MFDVLIIGAGCVGSAIARELSRFDLKIAVLDKEDDVSCGTSKANSGIIHGGYDAKYGTVKAALSKEGNESFTRLSAELGFAFGRCGSFVLAFSEAEENKIKEIYANGLKVGIEGMSIVDGDFVRSKEPNVSDKVVAALYCAGAGIVSPYEYTWALMENAVANGVALKLNETVIGIKKEDDGCFTVASHDNTYRAKIVINAAGVHADDIAAMTGQNDFVIQPVRGEYMLFDKAEGGKASAVLFQTPVGVSKGILVSPTVHGNLYVGPSYEAADDKDDVSTHTDILAAVFSTARKTMPDIDRGKVITQFAGMRAVADSADFIIGEGSVSGFINAAGISSPGLTTSYAIARRVRDLLDGMIELTEKKDFDPYREKPPVLASLDADAINDLIKKDAAFGRIVCRCERITEGEIRKCLSCTVPAHDLDGVKRRVRAGMGRCQGGFCMQKVMELICAEQNIKMTDVTKNGKGSYITPGKIFE